MINDSNCGADSPSSLCLWGSQVVRLQISHMQKMDLAPGKGPIGSGPMTNIAALGLSALGGACVCCFCKLNIASPLHSLKVYLRSLSQVSQAQYAIIPLSCCLYPGQGTGAHEDLSTPLDVDVGRLVRCRQRKMCKRGMRM